MSVAVLKGFSQTSVYFHAMIADQDRDARHVPHTLRRSMLDPALSGGCPLLAELFAVIAEDDVAAPLLHATPAWKIPGLLLSAALVHQAAADPAHPLARYLPGADAPLDDGLRAAVRAALARDGTTLAGLMAAHTYQCNPPRRLAVSLIALAAATRDWQRRPALHVDLGTASGIGLLLERTPRIERGSATAWLPRLVDEMPAGQPLIVTDTYVAVFMSEDQREALRRELDEIARARPVVWISNNPVFPLNNAPDRTTAGVMIPAELVERNREEMFGVVCATTWPDGARRARMLAVTHPGGCWLEWRPDLAR